MATGQTLMIQGSSSSAGKSLLAAALCRIFARHGLRVAPFKAQNMSNNGAVCADGSEVGRAQAVQAAAAGIEPTADMNPLLLKPEADARCQVVLQGRPWRTLAAGDYYQAKQQLWPAVTGALDRLRQAYDLVVIEGAGSPVELNLRSSDIVNMAVARYARSPVLLVGDIDRGGVFAQLLGTLWLLPAEEKRLVRGLLVNKFRGDRRLFDEGVQILEERAGVPVLAVVPYLPGLAIADEDAVALEGPAAGPVESGCTDLAVIRLPRIANFDDFDPLRCEPGVRLRYVEQRETLGQPHAVILPGTKSTMADLAWLQARGLDRAIGQLAAQGTAVVGLCGGYQMLGQRVSDPLSVESDRQQMAGLGLLPVETIFEATKATCRVQARVCGGPGWLGPLVGQTLEGYEIHMGRTACHQPWLEITRRNGQPAGGTDGAVVVQGRVWGCYLHGLFQNDRFRRAWLASLHGPDRPTCHAPASQDHSNAAQRLHHSLDRLADAVETALDLQRLQQILQD